MRTRRAYTKPDLQALKAERDDLPFTPNLDAQAVAAAQVPSPALTERLEQVRAARAALRAMLIGGQP